MNRTLGSSLYAAVFAGICALAVGLVTPTSASEEYRDFNELDLSALLDQVVVTASKHAQKISESPMAAYVITAEQIAVSGATSIPELLRDVPGLDILSMTASHHDISARGLNEPGSNSTLVMVDGRSVYADFFGQTIWEHVPVALEEIKAIEVILGPGSAFYGANAFACVINIITFDTDEFHGTTVRTAASTSGRLTGSAVCGQAGDGLGWRMSGSWTRTFDWEVERQEGTMARVHGRVDWQPSEESRASFSGSLVDGGILMEPTTQVLEFAGLIGHLSAEYAWRDLQVRWFWNTWELDMVPKTNLVILDDVNALAADVLDVELRHVLHPGGGHFIQWGGEFRHKTVDWSLQLQPYVQDLYSAFLYDEWRLSERLLLSCGARYDDHPLVGGHLAPRGGVVIRPTEKHALRGTYGIAYRDPTYLESYWHTEVAAFGGLTQLLRGDLGLDSEQIRSLEVGYQGMLRDDLLASVAVFRNEVRDMIDLEVVNTFPSPPVPYDGIPSEIAFQNDEDWLLVGGEVSLESRLSDRLSIRAHWAYVDVEDLDDGGQIITVPHHIAGAALIGTLPADHRAELRAHYRSGVTWRMASLDGPAEQVDGDEEFVLDARWHWRPNDGGTHLVVGVENLFDRRIRLHPLAIEQRRHAGVSLRIEF